MKKNLFACLAMLAMTATAMAAEAPRSVSANSTVDGEKAIMSDFKKAIPAEHVASVEALYNKWQEVRDGKSKAVIIDIRTSDEFASGHLLGSNNIDSGHAYSIPSRWADPNTEIWVFCRTKHRASYFAGTLYKYGYKNVYLVDGGLVAWIEKGYPLVNEYLGEIKVTKYDKRLKEEFLFREGR